jgi:hypothetical protein
LLNVLLQIANKLGISKKKKIDITLVPEATIGQVLSPWSAPELYMQGY